MDSVGLPLLLGAGAGVLLALWLLRLLTASFRAYLEGREGRNAGKKVIKEGRKEGWQGRKKEKEGRITKMKG